MRSAAALKRNCPGESSRSDVQSKPDLHLLGGRKRGLELGTLREDPGDSEADAAVEPVVRSARDHDSTPVNGFARRQRGARVTIRDRDVRDAHARPYDGAGGARFVRKRGVERPAVDHRGADAFGGDPDRPARRRAEGGRARDGQDRPRRQRQLVERVQPEKSGAMDGIPDCLVLFQNDDAMTRTCELARRHETGRTGSYYDDVPGATHQALALSFEL